MDGDRAELLTQEIPYTNKCPARADARDEGRGLEADLADLRKELGPGRPLMGLGIRDVLELLRPEDMLVGPCELVCPRNALRESALLRGDRDDRGPGGFQERLALGTHPVRHVDPHR